MKSRNTINAAKRLLPEEQAKEVMKADKTKLAALGGEPLAGSGFEAEEPEPGFGDTETSGPSPDQSPG